MAPPKIIPDNTLIFSGKTAQCIWIIQHNKMCT
jgi:hypothetical protein